MLVVALTAGTPNTNCHWQFSVPLWYIRTPILGSENPERCSMKSSEASQIGARQLRHSDKSALPIVRATRAASRR